jgi:hypothetical protein
MTEYTMVFPSATIGSMTDLGRSIEDETCSTTSIVDDDYI